ncbi:uncharacterized protein V3H82_013730 isoform 1-T1 [Fundulus diaphanus]
MADISAETAGAATPQSYKWTDEDTRELIPWRAANADLFTGRRNATLTGFEEFIKKKGLEGMLDAKAIRKRWENLVQKYKALKNPPEVSTPKRRRVDTVAIAKALQENEKQAEEVIQEMQREQREREEKREREAAEREERRHQEAVEREERRHHQTVEREERFFREMREREDRRDREMAAREREASAREERLLAILDLISKKI